ncbi:hypothetical protein E1B28_003900 [Marasmius oreades]|uniref:DUF6699 domain-containing protein n=1 Tax=Marasmius oreades TaxID=181124 RepID=A0A9P7UXH8_9AGAR|nr:uncharacterized protein E1B28_003900 [Marasmius oreades]KAG7096467.1 hypothetical protein E1B28_003900 [Marasmius oreades]
MTMMKHVRFAKTNTIHHLSKSISSRPLPDELLRVSTTPHRRSRTSSQAEHPYALYKPTNVLHPHLPIRLHFLLAFSPYKTPAIHYDLSLPFSIIQQSPSNSILTEPATEPPVSSLTITSPILKWSITVTPPPSLLPRQSPIPYVTVLDVLMALMRDMNIPVTSSEYQTLPSHDATAKVNEAYFQRCRNIADSASRTVEEARGVKRVDFLMGCNKFLGLSSRTSSRTGEMIWELNVA